MQNKPGNRKSHVPQRVSIFDQEVKKPAPQRHSVISTLRNTQIVAPKPALPIELIALILDHVPPTTLIRCARVSRKLKEVAYDDARWLAPLRRIGAWDDAAARRHEDETLRRRHEAARAAEQRRRRPNGARDTLFDVEVEDAAREAADGFDALVLTAGGPGKGGADAVGVLRTSRSRWGRAREAYGRIHAALDGLYRDAVREGTADPLVFRVFAGAGEQAVVLANLVRYARADGEEGAEGRAGRLGGVVGTFRNRVTNDFLAAYAGRDVVGMRRGVEVAVTLDGGRGIVVAFVDNHPLVRGEERLANPRDCVEGVTAGLVDLGPSRRFFERLAGVFQEQTALMDQVFPPSLDALTPLLDKISERVIRPFVTDVFSATEEAGTETYLKALAGVFEQCMRFAVSLQPTKASPSTFNQDVQTTLLKCFESYIDGYLAKELDAFRAKAEGEVQHWEQDLSDQESRNETFYMSNVSRQAAKRDFLSSFKKVVMMPVNAVAAFPLPGKAAAHISVEAPRTPTASPSLASGQFSQRPQSEAPTTELAAKAAIMNSRLEGIKSLFSIEVALNLIHHAKSAIERMAIFARHGGGGFSARAGQQCEAIFITLLDILGQRHIRAGFDKAVGHLAGYNPRAANGLDKDDAGGAGVEPLVTFLELVNVGDLIQQMVDVFFAQELVAARLTDRDDFLNPAAKRKKAFEQMLDERVAAGMAKGVDVLVGEVEHVCATTQAAADFNPGAAGGEVGVVDVGPTGTARRVADLVGSHTGMLVGSTDKSMLDVFFQEVGLRLFGALCKHLKRQRVSVDGAIKLISDINLYSATAAALKQKQLAPYFAALRELSQIYLIDCSARPAATTAAAKKAKKGAAGPAGGAAVDPARAKELAAIIADTERYRGVFAADEVLEFAERRADWYLIKGDVERAMFGFGCCVM